MTLRYHCTGKQFPGGITQIRERHSCTQFAVNEDKAKVMTLLIDDVGINCLTQYETRTICCSDLKLSNYKSLNAYITVVNTIVISVVTKFNLGSRSVPGNETFCLLG